MVHTLWLLLLFLLSWASILLSGAQAKLLLRLLQSLMELAALELLLVHCWQEPSLAAAIGASSSTCLSSPTGSVFSSSPDWQRESWQVCCIPGEVLTDLQATARSTPSCPKISLFIKLSSGWLSFPKLSKRIFFCKWSCGHSLLKTVIHWMLLFKRLILNNKQKQLWLI